jgi:NAD(P)-dependent dehydrogenase (short-subunit alcohol dehydrogenase family)
MSKEHVLITGGNKGIGLEATKLFVNAGFLVTIVARDFSNMEKLNNCNYVEFDLINVDKIKDLALKIGEIDILVNNAGIMNTCLYDDYPVDKKNDLLKINIEAPVELITCFSKGMISNKKGRIINIASIAGQIGHPDIWYGISKAGIINMTKSFAKTLGKHGIIVNAIAPGIVETEMLNSIPENRQKSILQSVQSGRFAKAEEIAKTILWLATESPEYLNGTCIDINDGAFPR